MRRGRFLSCCTAQNGAGEPTTFWFGGDNTPNDPERTMAILSSQPEIDDSTLETAEARMRRALGNLDESAGSAARQSDAARVRGDSRPLERHTGERPRARFVQDGDVPVTILNRARPHEGDAAGAQTPSRLSLAEAALAGERMARARAERSLAEAQAAVHDLETKWRHAELARQEQTARAKADKAAMEVELTALRDREQALLQQLEAEQAARGNAELAPRQDDGMKRAGRRAARPLGEDGSPPAAARPVKRVARTTGPKLREPKPVKWWLGSAKKP